MRPHSAAANSFSPQKPQSSSLPPGSSRSYISTAQCKVKAWALGKGCYQNQLANRLQHLFFPRKRCLSGVTPYSVRTGHRIPRERQMPCLHSALLLGLMAASHVSVPNIANTQGLGKATRGSAQPMARHSPMREDVAPSPLSLCGRSIAVLLCLLPSFHRSHLHDYNPQPLRQYSGRSAPALELQAQSPVSNIVCNRYNVLYLYVSFVTSHASGNVFTDATFLTNLTEFLNERMRMMACCQWPHE